MGTGTGGWGVWIWILFGLKIIGLLILWWFAWLPAIGQIPHSGIADPTVIKIFLTVVAPLCAVLLFLSYFGNALFSTSRVRMNSVMMPFGIATVLLVILTIWAWILDDEIQAVFIDGIPLIPAGYDATELKLYLEWTVFLIVTVVFLTIIIVAAIGGLASTWDVRTYRSTGKKISKNRDFARLKPV